MAPTPTMITDTEISGVLKNVYEDFRVDTWPILTALLALIEKAMPRMGKMQWGGNKVIGDAILSAPLGMSSSRLGHLGKNHIRKERQFALGVERLYLTREVDRLAVVGTTNKRAAYTKLLTKVLDEMRAAAKLGQQEIWMGNGRGIKATIASGTDFVSFTATAPYGIAGAGEGGLLLDDGLYCAVLNGSTLAVRGRGRLSTVTNSGDVATVVGDTSFTVAAGDFIVSASESDTSIDAYPNGTQSILNRGAAYNNFEEINAASFPRWDATRLVAGTNTPSADRIDESDIWRLIAKVSKRGGHDPLLVPNDYVLVATPGLRLKLMETYLGQRTIPIDSMEDIKGGFKTVRICGLRVIEDHYCPAGTVMLLHLPSLVHVDALDWGAVALEGAGPWRWIDQRDAYQTSQSFFGNNGTSQRNAHGMITGYTDTERFSHVM